MANLPSISTGTSTVAENLWPVVLLFDPTGSSRTTEIAVSTGTMMGFGLGAASFFGEADPDGEELAGDDASSELAV